jgi:hypothetical protein
MAVMMITLGRLASWTVSMGFLGWAQFYTWLSFEGLDGSSPADSQHF